MSDCVVQVAKWAFCLLWIHAGYVPCFAPNYQSVVHDLVSNVEE